MYFPFKIKVDEWVERNGEYSEKFGKDNLVLHSNILPSLKFDKRTCKKCQKSLSDPKVVLSVWKVSTLLKVLQI